MPRKVDPELVEEIRALGAKGYTQMEIAEKLKTNQPRISYLMKAYGIPKADYGVQQRNRIYAASGGIRVAVQVWGGDHILKTELNATPDQLRAVADYVEALHDQAVDMLQKQKDAA